MTSGDLDRALERTAGGDLSAEALAELEAAIEEYQSRGSAEVWLVAAELADPRPPAG